MGSFEFQHSTRIGTMNRIGQPFVAYATQFSPTAFGHPVPPARSGEGRERGRFMGSGAGFMGNRPAWRAGPALDLKETWLA
jgi:hypothetical protein